MKHVSILFIALLLSFSGYSQTAATYGFTPLSGTFTSISGTGTSTTSISSDDAITASISLPFNFVYCGTTYTSLRANSNGWISLAGSTLAGYPSYINATSSFSSIGSGVGLLMAYWDDLSGSGHTAYYQVSGTAPNRIFTFEWNNWSVLSYSGNKSYQVKLYETTNVIDFVYGTGSYSGSSATIGISNSTTDYQTLNGVSTLPTASSTTFSVLSGAPADGQIYRWTPPVACTGTPTAGTTVASPGTAGSCDAITLGLSGVSVATGLTYQWQSSTDGGVTWVNISGATNSTTTVTELVTTQYRCVVTCTASTLSANSTPVTVTYSGICFCTPSYYYTSPATFDAMSNFTMNGYLGSTINDNGPAVIPASGYENRLPISIDLLQGGVYSGSLTYTTSYYSYDMQIWIDYNDNGIFELSEEITPVSGRTGCAATGTTGTFTATISATATVGVHRMRVRQAETYSCTPETHMDPCNPTIGSYTYYYGCTRDYNANIIAPCPFTATVPTTATTCPNVPFTLTASSTATSYTWTGPGGFTSTTLNPTVPGISVPGVYTLTATNGTCTTYVSTSVSLLAAPPAPVVTPSVATICNGSSVGLVASAPPAPINLIPNENWESGVPTVPATPVDGWTTTSTSTAWLTQASSGSFPSATAQSGTYFADFHSFSYSTANAALISPSFSMTGITGGQFTFWVYRDNGYNTATYDLEGITIYMNTSASTTGATSLGYVPRRMGGSTSGSVTGTSTPSTVGWYQYTCSVPAAFSGSTNYIIFSFHSVYGNDIYLDNIVATGLQPLAPPVWTPTTYLYTDPAFTTPYAAGSTALNVYVHPTTVTTATTVNYIATITNGVCQSADTSIININPGVPAITGNSILCVAASTTLSNTTAGGTWTSSNTAIATVDPTTGVVTGVSAGVDTIYYTTPLGCSAFTAITITTLTTANTGNTDICSGGLTTVLSNPTAGGTWSAGSPSIASVDSTGLVTSGAAGVGVISYTLPWGCMATSSITSEAPPAAITGLAEVCYNGGTTNLFDGTPGGTWSSSAPTVATVNGTGVVTGLTSGTTTISYTTLPGCFATTPVILKANPPAITGTAAVCESGSVTTLSDAVTGGTWSIAGTTASIDASGVVTGITAGSAIVTYTAPNACYTTTTITVNPLPAPITGTFEVCQTNVTTLASASAGGTWTSGLTTVATVDAAGGVGGVAQGTAPITYTLPTGCRISANVLVDQIPAPLTGAAFVCNGSTTVFADITPGGDWSTSASAVATVNATGAVTGASVGSATITYTTGPGSCYATKPIAVSPVVPPSVAITASTGTTVCAGTPVTFTSTVSNAGIDPLYVWSVNNVILSNAINYTYTPNNGDVVRLWVLSYYACAIPDTASAVLTMTVNPIVTPSVTLSTGMGDTLCEGVIANLYAVPTGGGTSPAYQWYVNGTAVSGAPFYSYVPNNGDIVMVNIASNAPCRTATTASYTKVLTVSPFVTPMVTLNSLMGMTMCEGYPAVFTATQVNGGTAPTYQWAVNGVNTTTGSLYSYAPANGDNVQVTLTSNFPCVSTPTATANTTLTVLPVTLPIGSVYAMPGYIIPAGMYDTFTCVILSGGGSAPTYQWYKNSLALSGETNPVFITNDLISGDSISCQVTNTDQCSGVSNFNSVSIIVGDNVGVGNVATTHGNIAMLPNPNNGSFTIKGSLGIAADEDVTLEVTDMLGQIVYTAKANAANGELNERITLGTNLANGMYLLSMKSPHFSQTIHFALQQ